MMFLVTGKGPVGGVSKTHFTVGEALTQATSLVQRAFNDVRIRDPQGREFTPDEFAHELRPPRPLLTLCGPAIAGRPWTEVEAG